MTTLNSFKDYISQFPNYTEEAYNLVEPYLISKSVKKGDYLLRQGATCQNIVFIVQGLLKLYYLRDGVAITTCFCRENRFAASYKSLITGQPGDLSIQAIEDSSIVSIRYADLIKLYDLNPFWQQVGRMITEQEYLINECYSRLINDKPAKQRYLEILNNEPELIQRVSLSDLASYLQVTPETIRCQSEVWRSKW